jgi:hypothetical protein
VKTPEQTALATAPRSGEEDESLALGEEREDALFDRCPVETRRH